MTFRISERELGGEVLVVELQGEGDLIAAPELRRHIDDAIGRGATKLILDLSSATFIDSTALGILVGALKRLRPRGGRIAVLCPDPAIRHVSRSPASTGCCPWSQRSRRRLRTWSSVLRRTTASRSRQERLPRWRTCGDSPSKGAVVERSGELSSRELPCPPGLT